jgi:hypothetical protein
LRFYHMKKMTHFNDKILNFTALNSICVHSRKLRRKHEKNPQMLNAIMIMEEKSFDSTPWQQHAGSFERRGVHRKAMLTLFFALKDCNSIFCLSDKNHRSMHTIQSSKGSLLFGFRSFYLRPQGANGKSVKRYWENVIKSGIIFLFFSFPC